MKYFHFLFKNFPSSFINLKDKDSSLSDVSHISLTRSQRSRSSQNNKNKTTNALPMSLPQLCAQRGALKKDKLHLLPPLLFTLHCQGTRGHHLHSLQEPVQAFNVTVLNSLVLKAALVDSGVESDIMEIM